LFSEFTTVILLLVADKDTRLHSCVSVEMAVSTFAANISTYQLLADCIFNKIITSSKIMGQWTVICGNDS
jgi:hypothetical protein